MKRQDFIQSVVRAELSDKEQIRAACLSQNLDWSTSGKAQTRKERSLMARTGKRLILVAACAALVVVAAAVIGNNGRSPTPPIWSGSASSTQADPGTQAPNSSAVSRSTEASERAKPLAPSSGVSAPAAQMNPSAQQSTASPNSGAAYHPMDVSALVMPESPSKLPFAFWFSNRLMGFAKNETGLNTNNGVRWDDGVSFTSKEADSALQLAINEPIFPYGDYTTAQSVLIDEASGKILAYKTLYYFFDKRTNEVQYSFSTFYMAAKDFQPNSFSQSENIVFADGMLRVNAPATAAETHTKAPHVRCFTYLHNGIAIVVEANASPILAGNRVDEAKSLEKYEQLDKALASTMESLIR